MMGKDLYKDLYYDLLYAVETKHNGETRHNTALRYIKEAENKTKTAVKCQNPRNSISLLCCN